MLTSWLNEGFYFKKQTWNMADWLYDFLFILPHWILKEDVSGIIEIWKIQEDKSKQARKSEGRETQ